jgi:cytochrome c oxidase subunit 2
MPAAVDTRSAYQDLFGLYVAVAVGVFVLVALALAVVGVRYRARAGAEPSPRTNAPRLELGYALGLMAIAAVLLWRSFAAMSDTSPPAITRAAAGGGGGLTLTIVASRWNWRITYPGGVVQTGDGHDRPATLVVPAGSDVRFRLTSRDVVHALWIPALRTKYDAMPGYVNAFDLRFDAGRDYSTVRCSEFCGVLHDKMRLRVDVRSPRDFAAWLRARREALRT